MISKVTQSLNELSSGDVSQKDRLFELVYQDFRKIAQRYLGNEGPAVDLQATDIVHEAYVRLVDQSKVCWKGRSHFFSVGANIMRQVLVDHARSRQALKRGGGTKKLSLTYIEGKITLSPQSDDDVLAVDGILEQLASVSEQRAKIVELRFFAGLTVQETAEALRTSKSTIEREWRVARAWLRRELSKEDDTNSG